MGFSVRWDSIAKINKTKTVQSLSIWFVVLPIAAKLLQENSARVPWEGAVLPFTWGIFYLASLCFFAAMAIYAGRCPKIVRDYDGWSDFIDREGSYEKLIPLLTQVATLLPRSSCEAFILRQFDMKHLRFLDAMGGDIPRSRVQEALASAARMTELFSRTIASSAAVADIYASAREQAQFARPISRRAIEVAQVAGFILLGWVACENAFYVFSYYFPAAAAHLKTITWNKLS